MVNAVILNKHPLIIDWIPKYFFDLPYYRVGTKVSSIDDLKGKIKMVESGQTKTSEKDYRIFYDYFITPIATFQSKSDVRAWCVEFGCTIENYDRTLGNCHVFIIKKDA